jgi:RNA-directed DNA polymerase
MSNSRSITDFLALSTPRELAAFLGVRYDRHLVYNLYKLPSQSRYKTFQIKRKNGEYRAVVAPNNSLKMMQSTIARFLLQIYQPKPSVHGYCLGRSIVANAQSHKKSRFILNVDLETFFPSINFGRVRGMFLAEPFTFSPPLATVLAQLCCHNNELPLGAPTSPIIANIICARLDRQLQRLARSHDCRYTRYSDDMTLSTRRSRFPEAIAILEPGPSVQLGNSFLAIIHANGFRVNESKTRLLGRSVRQEVTGLVVNQFPNLRRTDIRRIRAMLHAWEKYGRDPAQEVYYSRYATKIRLPEKKNPQFEEMMRGTLAFFKSVKGEADQVYKTLARQFNRIARKPIVLRDLDHMLKECTWIIEDADGFIQGTGFFLDGFGFVTCAHCVGAQPHIYQPGQLLNQKKVRVIAKNDDIDIAILELEEQEPKAFLLASDSQRIPQYLEAVTLVGYASHAPGREISIKRGEVVSFAVKSTIKRFNISAAIVGGNSDGPVLDRHLRVIGVAVTGADREDQAHRTEDHGVIPIQALAHLRQNRS